MAVKIPKIQLSNEQIKVIAAVAMFAAVGGFLYWKYLWAPYSKRIQAAETKIEKINTDIASALAMAKRLDKLNAEIDELRRQEKNAEQRLPKGKKVPDLIYTLMDISKKYRVQINSITPQNSVDKQYYTEVNYQMSVTGNYHAVGRFLSAIASSQRVFNMQNLNISGSGGAVSASFILIAYQYRG